MSAFRHQKKGAQFERNLPYRAPRGTGMAIDHLAAELLPFTIEDTDGLDNSVWTALVNEMRDEMIAMILGKEGDVPRPTWQ